MSDDRRAFNRTSRRHDTEDLDVSTIVARDGALQQLRASGAAPCLEAVWSGDAQLAVRAVKSGAPPGQGSAPPSAPATLPYHGLGVSKPPRTADGDNDEGIHIAVRRSLPGHPVRRLPLPGYLPPAIYPPLLDTTKVDPHLESIWDTGSAVCKYARVHSKGLLAQPSRTGQTHAGPLGASGAAEIGSGPGHRSASVQTAMRNPSASGIL